MRIIGLTTLVLIVGAGGAALANDGPFTLSAVVNPANVFTMSEPALLLSLGVGLFGSAAAMRRHRQNRS